MTCMICLQPSFAAPPPAMTQHRGTGVIGQVCDAEISRRASRWSASVRPDPSAQSSPHAPTAPSTPQRLHPTPTRHLTTSGGTIQAHRNLNDTPARILTPRHDKAASDRDPEHRHYPPTTARSRHRQPNSASHSLKGQRRPGRAIAPATSCKLTQPHLATCRHIRTPPRQSISRISQIIGHITCHQSYDKISMSETCECGPCDR